VGRVPTTGASLLAGTAMKVAFDDRGSVMRTALIAQPDGALETWQAYERPFSLGPDWGGNSNLFTSDNVTRIFDALLTQTGAGSSTMVLGSTVAAMPSDAIYLIHAGIQLITTNPNVGGVTVTAEARLVQVQATAPCTIIAAVSGWKTIVDFICEYQVTAFTGIPPAPTYVLSTNNPLEGQFVSLAQRATTPTRSLSRRTAVRMANPTHAWRRGGSADHASVRAGHAGDGQTFGGQSPGTWIAFRRNSYDPQPVPTAC